MKKGKKEGFIQDGASPFSSGTREKEKEKGGGKGHDTSL